MKKELSKEFKDAISKIPPNKEWWTSGGQSTFEQIALVLLNKGFSEEDILDLLTAAYCAVAAEFGN